MADSMANDYNLCSEAVYLPEVNAFKLTKVKGKQLSNRGFSCLGEEYLWPEDVLYLAQNDFLRVFLTSAADRDSGAAASDSSSPSMNRVYLSLEDLTCLVFTRPPLPFSAFAPASSEAQLLTLCGPAPTRTQLTVYSNLSRLGFIVRRHTPPPVSTPHTLPDSTLNRRHSEESGALLEDSSAPRRDSRTASSLAALLDRVAGVLQGPVAQMGCAVHSDEPPDDDDENEAHVGDRPHPEQQPTTSSWRSFAQLFAPTGDSSAPVEAPLKSATVECSALLAACARNSSLSQGDEASEGSGLLGCIYEVYNPEAHFARSAPPAPNYLLLCGLASEPLPSASEMCRLLDRCAKARSTPVPLLVALVDGDDVVFLELKSLDSANFAPK